MDNAVYSEGQQSVGVPPVEGVAGGGTGYGWMDGTPALSGSIKGLAEVDPTKVPSSDLLHVWCMPSTANVGQQELPRPLEPISLLAARNERESVQMALRPRLSWGGPGIAGAVQIQCTDLCSAEGNRLEVGKSLTMRHVVPILGVPDALVPLDLPVDQINLHPGETTAIWVSITVPFGQPPGHYEGEIFATAIKADTKSKKLVLAKSEKHQFRRELQKCLKLLDPVEGTSAEEVLNGMKCASSTLEGILAMCMFSDFSSTETIVDMMEEDSLNSLSIRVKLIVTVWDFVIPITPSLPAVFGVSETVIEDRFGLNHGSREWYDALDSHFRWLLQYRISPFFCRWGDSMRVHAYTCPWPADHPKSDECYGDPRLAAYAVPFSNLSSCEAKDAIQREIEILRAKEHWGKAYFYLWDEPLNLEQYEFIRNMSNEIRSYAPDARVLTTYYCGPRDATPSPSNFEAFTKVPNILRPHTQIFCTRCKLFLGTLLCPTYT